MNELRNLILITLIFFASLLFGQTDKIETGIEIGPSLISLRGNNSLESHNDLSIGFSSGLSFQYNLSIHLSIRTNVSFERKGVFSKVLATDENGYPIAELTVHSNYNYLTVPILGRLTFGKGIKFFVNAGPYFGYLIKQNDLIEPLWKFQEKIEFDNTDNFERLDYGLTTGFGANFPINNKLLLSLEIRNNLGLLNISAIPIENEGTIKTNSTNLLIGIAYRFGEITK